VTGGWRKLHNEKAPYVIFFSSYYYDDSEKEDHMDGLVARRNVKRYKTFVGMPEGKSYTREIKHGLEDNIKMDLKEKVLVV
jgi:hypothetical protein